MRVLRYLTGRQSAREDGPQTQRFDPPPSQLHSKCSQTSRGAGRARTTRRHQHADTPELQGSNGARPSVDERDPSSTMQHCRVLGYWCAKINSLPNLAAISITARSSLTPPIRQLSIWQKLIASACISCLKITRFWATSPVATPILIGRANIHRRSDFT